MIAILTAFEDLWIWFMRQLGFMPIADLQAAVDLMNSPIIWIPASRLAPVECPLMLNLGPDYDFDIAYGERVDHLTDKNGIMLYRLSTGEHISGRFDWTYP